jgi:dCMP deaminase
VNEPRLSRDDTLLTVAFTVAKRSTCTRLHVGAVAALDGRILVTGYNGAPAGTPHCSHPKSEVCQRSVHAEANIVAYAARHGVSLQGASVYATDSPCYTCACLLINAGISSVVFVRRYRDDSGLRLLVDVGVKVYHIDTTNVEVPPSEDRNPYEVCLEGLRPGGDASPAERAGL